MAWGSEGRGTGFTALNTDPVAARNEARATLQRQEAARAFPNAP